MFDNMKSVVEAAADESDAKLIERLKYIIIAFDSIINAAEEIKKSKKAKNETVIVYSSDLKEHPCANDNVAKILIDHEISAYAEIAHIIRSAFILDALMRAAYGLCINMAIWKDFLTSDEFRKLPATAFMDRTNEPIPYHMCNTVDGLLMRNIYGNEHNVEYQFVITKPFWQAICEMMLADYAGNLMEQLFPGIHCTPSAAGPAFELNFKPWITYRRSYVSQINEDISGILTRSTRGG